MQNIIFTRIKPFIPRRLRRLYRKYISPVIKDFSYYEYQWHKDFFRKAFYALAFNGINGDYAEFGCCGGITFCLAYKMSRQSGYNCTLWAFDSFCGLPPKTCSEDEHPVWIEGSMSVEIDEFKKICSENNIPRKEYRIISGFYENTLKNNQDILPDNIALAFIDCDLYSSTKHVFDFLLPRLKHGMIIALDDYYCWTPTQLSGEQKACAEYFDENSQWCLRPFIQFGWGGMSFIVENRNAGKTSNAGY